MEVQKEDVKRDGTRKRKGKKSKEGKEADRLKLNPKFAKQYEVRKRREILGSLAPEQLEELNEDSDASDDTDEEEDEFGEQLTKKMDSQITKTLLALQAKDPSIYKEETTFFKGSRNDVDKSDAEDSDAEDPNASSEDEPVAGWDAIARAAEAAAPKMTIKDYVRETLLKDGELANSDDERGRRRRHVEEENEDVARAKTVLEEEVSSESDSSSSDGDSSSDDDEEEKGEKENDGGDMDTGEIVDSKVVEEKDGEEEESDVEDDDDDGDFFKKKKKTKEEQEQEDDDFNQFTKRLAEKGSKRTTEEDLLHSYLDHPQDEKDKFLRDFVLSNGWLEKEAGPAPSPNDYDAEMEDGGEEFDDKVDAFEAEYNFRFEEPDGTQVASHARSISGSMRRPDDRRKRAREARKERKNKEKLVKTEEIKHLKNLKKQEVQSRLLALQEAAGTGMDFSGIDLDADFDPDAFSKQMEAKFGDEYYEQEDAELKTLNETTAVASEKRPDAGVVIKKNEAADEPELHSAVDKLMDEYYNLDYEDIVDGVPVRFNYKQVEAEDFGMSAVDILDEDDKELNQRASIKYLAPYRDRKDVKARAKTARWKAKQKRRNVPKVDAEIEAQCGSSGGRKKRKPEIEQSEGEAAEQVDSGNAAADGESTKKKKRKKEASTSHDAADGGSQKTKGGVAENGDVAPAPKKKRKRRRGGESVKEPVPEEPKLSAKEQRREEKKKATMAQLSAKRLAAYNIN